MPWRFDKLGIDSARIGAMHAAYERACALLDLSPVPDRIDATSRDEDRRTQRDRE